MHVCAIMHPTHLDQHHLRSDLEGKLFGGYYVLERALDTLKRVRVAVLVASGSVFRRVVLRLAWQLAQSSRVGGVDFTSRRVPLYETVEDGISNPTTAHEHLGRNLQFCGLYAIVVLHRARELSE